MDNRFSRSYFGSPFCGPRYHQHRNTSTMCLFGEHHERDNLWTSPETIQENLFFVLDDKKEPDSRITLIKAACEPLFNTVRDFFRKTLPTLAPAPKQDCPDYSNMGLVTATLPPRPMEHNRMAGDLVDLSTYAVIHTEKMCPPKATKSDLNCPRVSPSMGRKEIKMPTRRQRKTSQNTQKSRKGKHTKGKMRKKFIMDLRDDMQSEDDCEEEFEDVLSQEISSSIEDSTTSSQSPHTSDYVCDFIASIPSSEPRKISPCAFVKNLPAVLRMDIPFSPIRRQQPKDNDSDDSFIVFCSESPKGDSICDRISKYRDGRRKLSEESDDSFVIFADDSECEDDSDTESETSDSDTEPIQLDSGFEERKVRFNLKPDVHVIRAWEFAYRQARKGEWDQVARDRDRFEKRILSLGRVLSPVLEQSHREKIFKERFRCD